MLPHTCGERPEIVTSLQQADQPSSSILLRNLHQSVGQLSITVFGEVEGGEGIVTVCVKPGGNQHELWLVIFQHGQHHRPEMV